MKLKYYTSFAKRKNSTKQPTGGTEIDVYLKEPCSIFAPVFRTFTDVKAATYVYVSDWSRYYFVTDVTYDGNEYILSCASDPMATFKSAIGSTSAYIEFTSSSSNIKINDPRNKPTVDVLTKDTNLGSLPTFDTTANCYIVGVADDSGISYYMMSATKCADLLSEMYDKSINGQLTRDFFDMNNVLISCCVMPRHPLTGSDSIIIGNPNGIHVTLMNNVYRISPTDRMITLYEDTKDINYPSDDLGLAPSYIDEAPYSTGVLYLPFVGCVEIDLGAIVSQKSLYVKCTFDQINGDLVYKIGLDSDTIIGTYSGNCAANVPVSGSSYNPIGAAAGVLGVIGGVATLAAGIVSDGATTALAGLGGIVAGGNAVYNSLSMHTQTNGSLSSYIGSSLGLDIRASVFTKSPVETALTNYQTVLGMPYYKVNTISNCSGYIKCTGASVSMSSFSEERDIVNGYLNSGFYYE